MPVPDLTMVKVAVPDASLSGPRFLSDWNGKAIAGKSEAEIDIATLLLENQAGLALVPLCSLSHIPHAPLLQSCSNTTYDGLSILSSPK